MSEETTAANPADEGAPVEQVIDAPSDAEATDVQAEDAGEDDLSDLVALGNGEPEATPEFVDVEIDGKIIKVSPEGKDFLLRQADYTRKTMELADERKSIAAIQQEAEQLRSLTGEKLNAVVTAQRASARVEELLATPIDGLSQDQVNALRLDLSDAQAQAAQWAAHADQIAAQEDHTYGQRHAKACEDARKAAALHIPNFDDVRLAALGSLVEKLGGDAGQVKQIADPTALRVLHLADIGQKFLERQGQAKKIAAAQGVQPVPEAGGRSSPATKDLVKDADRMSTEEWLKQREAQVAKANKR